MEKKKRWFTDETQAPEFTNETRTLEVTIHFFPDVSIEKITTNFIVTPRGVRFDYKKDE